MSEVVQGQVVEPSEATYTSAERRKVIAASGLGWGLEFFDLTLVALLAKQISDDFDISLAQLGSVFTAQLIATALGGVVFGRLADLYGRKRVLTWTIWVFGLATAACALAPNLAVFLVLRVITGLGVGGEWAVGFALLNEAWSPKRRGLAGGAVQAAIWPAYAVAIFVTGAVSDWRHAFAIGIFPVLAAIWVRQSCPESKQWLALQRGEGSARQLSERQKSSPLAELFSGDNLKTLLVGTIVVFGAQYSYYVYSSWMPTYLKGDLGIAPDTAQTVLYVSAAIALVSYVSAGALSDSFGRRRSLLLFATIQLAAFIVFAALNALDGATPLIIASYFVISFGLGYFAIFGAWFGELFATPIRATGSSFCYSVGRGFASFGPFIVGYLAADYGLGGGISTGLLAVLVMMGFACLLTDRRGRLITAAE
ncbi:MFS transporter [Nocardioides sp. LHG3406-4]|uniref:MFS transporter n=1 Tax=Nocardioides sp. LHG3406-4 TaxID=2804575 RepID=UPI003CF6740A